MIDETQLRADMAEPPPLLRPKDWSQELDRVTELARIPGMTIARALRIMETYIPAQQFYGGKNEVNRATAIHNRWPTYGDGTPLYRLVAVGGQTVPILSHLNNEIIQPVVADLVRDNTDAIVELGCGMARHLLGLRDVLEHRYPRLRYYGADLSPSALAVSATLAALETNRALVTFHKFNYLEPDFSWIEGKPRNVIFFSCHSIEQVGQIGPRVFKAMCAAGGYVTGVHEEPFGWQIPFDGDDALLAQSGQIPKAMGWNSDLWEVLDDLEKRDRLIVELVARHCSGNGIYNPGSLVIWTKVPRLTLNGMTDAVDGAA